MSAKRECAKCADPISEQRLRVLPFARLCLDCASTSDVPRMTAFSPRVQKALVTTSISDLDERAAQTREIQADLD